LKKEEELLVGYLYGSFARGNTTDRSDIDIGVLISEDFETGPLYESKLSVKIESTITTQRDVEVRVLNDQPLRFLHQVLKYGKMFYCKDEIARIRFETRVYDKYIDFKPFIKEYNELRRKRLLHD
nr:nucleotidyltransferase domain-containing protein [Candidatus Korarchaeota archaeon]NIU85310.1 hypothetical protein [Candidatus Thorarchaeota archaeon]NIW15410.1 hypothetical protein [Candidatus Thorarchaeota archaeon]NIW53354.1 hypothetical protein [Candidatus Korarchaeota archaeon]